MELKLRISCNPHAPFDLLIVPYGIETTSGGIVRYKGYILLIVPYGIETKYLIVDVMVGGVTFNCTLWN